MKRTITSRLFSSTMALGLIGLAATASGDSLTPSGAIFTTTSDGTVVNGNIYDNCCDAYLNGGPQNQHDAGLPVGDYYFQVTEPGWHPDQGVAGLLSTDPAACRIVHVSLNSGGHGVVSGVLAGPGNCQHPLGTPNDANGSTPVRLCDFKPTTNPGGEYKVWLIPVAAASTVDADGIVLTFSESDSKTDNFKCRQSITILSCPEPIEVCNDDGTAGAVVKYPDPILPANLTLVGCVPASGSVFGIGTTTVTCTASDNSTCHFDVTVDDCLGITCPGDISVCVPPGAGGSVVLYQTPTTASGGDGTTVTISCDPPSGSTFATGVTTVTCTAADAHTTAQCSFKITVSDDPTTCANSECTAPTLSDLTQCVCGGVSEVVMNYTEPTAPDGETFLGCLPASGSSFPVGSTPVTCYFLKDGFECSSGFNVVVKAYGTPTISQPSDINACLININGNTETISTPTASDTCGGALTPVGTRSDGKALSDPYPCGTTVITWNVSDGCGTPAQAVTQNVTITCGSICAKKFYDANANGKDDDGKVVKGFKITLTGTDLAANTVSLVTQYTDSTGCTCFTGLPLGTYSVSEIAPNSGWVPTVATTITGVALSDCAQTPKVCFGNFCEATPVNGLTLGFWGNSNGKARLQATGTAWVTRLNTYNLRKNSSSTPGYAVPTGTFTTSYTSFSSWLQGANATDMAYMLSAQMATTILDVNYNGLNGNTILVVSPLLKTQPGANVVQCLTGKATGFTVVNGYGYISVANLIVSANTELAADPYTVASGAARTYQECLKDLLDQVNNNGNNGYNIPLTIVSQTPCSFTSPY
jgi:hypothetical protein